ncbi:ABC transporter ATP-binding protein [Saliterribacillus persicus]|uniref:ABC-2 type transport system ATP-binding protein n=1 Tax=Saliterribacillus persicus TaxID=930114 RepID=A0A368Y9C1_9BACI|nr:ABC transporter ATP-binding protein [Saliterribacillus persicus]RCW76870.1 ABC-2 type transport system ATP-binding protein [Saliterribacillus persicus]
MEVLELIDIHKNIKSHKILTGINLKMNTGEIIGLIGSNGAGKSTLLKIISNLLKPSEGEVLINNINVHDNFQQVANEIGYLIEEPVLYPYLTAKEHLHLALKLHGKPINDKQINSLATMLDITPFLHKKTKNYSMGMKQKLGIACAVIHNPDIVILDEPTNSIDIKGINLIKKFILQLKSQGKLVIVSSHLLQEIKNICDHYIMIENGELINTDSLSTAKSQQYLIYFKETPETQNKLEPYYPLHKSKECISIEISHTDLNSTLKFIMDNNIHISDIEKVELSFENFL